MPTSCAVTAREVLSPRSIALSVADDPVEEVVDLVLVVALPELGGRELLVQDVVRRSACRECCHGDRPQDGSRKIGGSARARLSCEHLPGDRSPHPAPLHRRRGRPADRAGQRPGGDALPVRGEPTAPELVRERHLPSILAGYERWGGRFGLFAAQEKDGGAFVGWFCLRPERDGPLDEVELGYRLRQEAWGKGYATEVAAALLAKAFSELDVRVVWGATMSRNLASQKVMEKVDMTVTETLATPEDMLAVEGSELGWLPVRDHARSSAAARGQDGSR